METGYLHIFEVKRKIDHQQSEEYWTDANADRERFRTKRSTIYLDLYNLLGDLSDKVLYVAQYIVKTVFSVKGPALMALLSKALPLTASCLTTSWVRIPAKHVRKLPVIAVRRWFLPFPPVSPISYDWLVLTLYSRDMAEKVTKNPNSKFFTVSRDITLQLAIKKI